MNFETEEASLRDKAVQWKSDRLLWGGMRKET